MSAAFLVDVLIASYRSQLSAGISLCRVTHLTLLKNYQDITPPDRHSSSQKEIVAAVPAGAVKGPHP